MSPDHHRYVADQEQREEGGTPAIIGSIRAGLAFKLKGEVGTDRIRELEHDFIRRAIESWETNPNIDILGNHDAERLSIVSFVVKAGDRVLHHNYVVALLNDLFGIQARGGCSCAGPYGHRLLGIDRETSARLEDVIADGCEVIKPGWVRLNFNYFISEEEFQFILGAVHMIANDGWRLLAMYTYETSTGIWRHRDGLPQPPKSLSDFAFGEDLESPAAEPIGVLDSYLEEAKRILAHAPLGDGDDPVLSDTAEKLRWFPTPMEVPK